MAKKYTQQDGQRLFEEYKARVLSEPEAQARYQEALQRKELWLQLVEARQAAGLTQAEVAERMGVTQSQVSRVEKPGYERQSLTTLRRYIEALDGKFTLEVIVRPTHNQ